MLFAPPKYTEDARVCDEATESILFESAKMLDAVIKQLQRAKAALNFADAVADDDQISDASGIAQDVLAGLADDFALEVTTAIENAGGELVGDMVEIVSDTVKMNLANVGKALR